MSVKAPQAFGVSKARLSPPHIPPPPPPSALPPGSCLDRTVYTSVPRNGLPGRGGVGGKCGGEGRPALSPCVGGAVFTGWMCVGASQACVFTLG